MIKLKLALLVALSWVLPGCSPVDALNWLTPGDGYRTITDLAYGEGPRRKLDVYVPDGVTPQHPAPVVVFFYGGSWSEGRRGDYRFVAQSLVAMGYVVAIPDYRLWPEVRYPDFLTDSAAAVGWVARQIGPYGGDAQRLVLMGHSAGAYNAAMLALQPDLLPAHGVALSAVRGFVGLAGPYNFAPFIDERVIRVFGHLADPAPSQPISYVRADAPPLLLLHGEGDESVFPRNTLTLDQAQRAAQGQSRSVLYPDIGHVRLILGLSAPFRHRGPPVFDDVALFLRDVTR